MRIAFVSDVGAGGGAAIAANRLAAGLRGRGHQIHRIYRREPPPPPASYDVVTRLVPRTRGLHRLRGVMHREVTRELASGAWSDAFRQVLARSRPDVVHVHNLHGAGWDLEVLDACLESSPVAWTWHDMWPLTGSCAYAFDCRGYLSSCSGAICPQVGVYPTLPAPMIEAAHERRRAFYARARSRPCAFVAPSRWLAEVGRQVTPAGTWLEHVPNYLDTARFCPPAGRAAPEGLPRLLASAARLDDPRKGLDLLLEALTLLGEPTELRLIGDGRVAAPPGIHVAHTGVLASEQDLLAAYAAAELFVHPARADNEPIVIREAMACALPVVALPAGGAPELVQGAGWISAAATAPSLARALSEALEERRSWRRLGEDARRCALRRNASVLDATERLYGELRSSRQA